MPKDKITVQKAAKDIKNATVKAGTFVVTKTKQVYYFAIAFLILIPSLI